MALTEIILKENIPGLGAEADIVKVRKGYARNHLVPTGKAYEVTSTNLKRLNLLKAKRAEREVSELNEAEELARKIEKVRLDFVLQTGETGKAFGSVTSKDIEDKLQTEHTISIDRHQIELDRPIKESGERKLVIKLHHDVTATLKIEVKSSTPIIAVDAEQSETGGAKVKRKTKPAA